MSDIQKSNLLIVNDQPENLRVLENILEGMDCLVLKATSEDDAVEMVFTRVLAVVLIDLQTSGMDGFEVAKRIRRQKPTQQIPILFVTDSSQEQKYIFKDEKGGLVDYVFRPIEPEILKSKVTVLIELDQQRKLIDQQRIEFGEKIKTLEDEIAMHQQLEGELLQTKESAEAAAKVKFGFLANMGHKLRTPLNAMIGYTSLTLTALKHSLPPQHLQNLTNAEQSARSLLQSINNIIDFSKIEAGKIEIAIEEFELREIMGEVILVAEGLLQNKPVKLKTEIMDALPPIEGDYTKIKQILNNLVNNAVKFTNEGYIIVRAMFMEDLNAIRVEVEDTGCGMLEEKVKAIFETFAQIDEASKKKFDEPSLGLIIVQRFCELLKIDIGVNHEPDQGTIFWLHIPVTPLIPRTEQEQIVIPPADADLKKIEGKRIKKPADYQSVVVIDDNELSLDLSEAIFESAGYTVYTAQSAQAGIALIIQKQPDLVLMDLAMPDINGLEATRILKENPKTVHIPVIGCSALTEKTFKDEALQAGCVGYIEKPIEPHRLIAQVKKTLGIKKK